MHVQSSERLGFFVVIEGPNGVGKSAVITSLLSELDNIGLTYFNTKEPTSSQLGMFVRQTQGVYSKEVFACLVAANRYEHISKIIEPKLKEVDLVISDRYFPSSLVYQVIDGVDVSFLEAINSRILKPDLTIILMGDEEALADRIAERQETTRFETVDIRRKEIQLYGAATEYLLSKKWEILVLKNTNTELSETVSKIINRLKILVFG